MSITSTELDHEQDHYNAAFDEREEHREQIGKAAGAAARPQDAREIRTASLRMQDAMPSTDEPAFFARVDVEPSAGGAPQARYLGLCAVHDEDERLLVMNFRAPAAACYYKATPANKMGMSRKRTFEVGNHRVLGYEDVVLRELEKNLDALEKALHGPGDALLRDLEASRDGSMRQIAQTIGAAQYDVISRPLDRLLVVQGGPGTGKTAVALHRVSYWLYNSQDSEDPTARLAPSDVLVVGPSRAFMRYISRVLPDLGDGDIEYQNLHGLGPQRSTGRVEGVPLATLKGDARMAGLLDRALRNRIRIPTERLAIGAHSDQLLVPAESVRVQVLKLQNLPYRSGRREFSEWLSDHAEGQGRDFPAEVIGAAVDRVWPLSTAPRFFQELLASQNMLLTAAGEDFTAAEVQSLYRPAARRITEEEWSDADVALIDEIESLMEGRGSTFKHIVVDEAQDVSDMQLRSLRRRSLNGSMTVVGDLAQSTGPHARRDWNGIIEGLEQGLESELVELGLGYRVPKQVFDFAARLLPYAARGIAVPQVIRTGPSEPELLKSDVEEVADAAVTAATRYASHGAFVGMVCPQGLRDDLTRALKERSIKWADGDTGLNAALSSINVVSPEAAKGLEFDAVVVVEPEAIVASDPHGLRLLYIALTRTTAHLSVVHSGREMPLPETNTPVEGTEVAATPASEATEPADAVLPASGEVTIQGLTETQTLRFQESTIQVGTMGQAPPPPNTLGNGASAPVFDLSSAVVAAAASEVADGVRQSIPEAQWPRLIDELRRKLGITDEQLFEMLG